MKSVALGGGHGTAVTLRALLQFSSHVTGVVSIADDGGSSGDLRRAFNIPAVGDIRRCLSATSDQEIVLSQLLERHVGSSHHPLGNLLIAAAIIEFGDIATAIGHVTKLTGSTVDLLPATSEAVNLRAKTHEGYVEGQVRVHGRSDIEQVEVLPVSAVAPAAVVQAIDEADLIVSGPGSLFTSVLATLVVSGVNQAIQRSHAPFVFIANLSPEIPETEGIGLREQLSVLENHGLRPDCVLCDERFEGAENLPVQAVFAPISDEQGTSHDPTKVARALRALMAN